MSRVHPMEERDRARQLLAAGATVSVTARELGVGRDTVRRWRDDPVAVEHCPRCRPATLQSAPYAALLGFYLGDGHLATFRGKRVLRVSCDATYPGIIDDVSHLVGLHSPHAVHHVSAPGCIVVTSGWKHWSCLLPQHGPGRKHERDLELERWQQVLVEDSPGAFLGGLLHSDGCRTNNWARQLVGGTPKRDDYPRWQFSNASADIRRFYCETLDLVGVPWRHSAPRVVSVSTRAGVARLDELVGPKS